MGALKSNKIILIVGPACSGKSTIAFELSKLLKIRQLIDTDIVRAIKIAQEPDNKYINTFSFKVWSLFGTTQSKDYVIRGYKKYSSQIRKEIDGLINENSKLNRNVIIEGVHLCPSFLKKYKDKDDVIIIAVDVDEERHKNNFIKRSRSANLSPDMYLDNFKSLRIMNDFIAKEVKSLGGVVIKNSDVKKTIKKICEVIQ